MCSYLPHSSSTLDSFPLSPIAYIMLYMTHRNTIAMHNDDDDYYDNHPMPLRFAREMNPLVCASLTLSLSLTPPHHTFSIENK